jgi:imidazolonepropionase-like amidohydrolase
MNATELPPSPTVVLAGVLIDGTGAEPRLHQALLLQDGRITGVLPQAELTRTQTQDAVVLDAGDAAVLPGLIDTHVHVTLSADKNHELVRKQVTTENEARLALRGIANARAHLAGGVTTIRDVGGPGFVTLSVRDAIRDGLVLGPRMRASGPAISTTTGHLNFFGSIANSAAEMRARAAEVLDAGADLVKLCATGGIMTAESSPMGSQYTVEELRQAVKVAESRGTLVAAHVLASDGLRRCVEAGVRSIEHCLWQDEPGEFHFDQAVGAVMREKKIFAGLTFAAISQVRYWEHALGRRPAEDMGKWVTLLVNRYAAEREMIAAGVKYVLHSDAGVRETPFGTFWLIPATACFELALSPLEAIRAVTSSAAELMGLDQEIGTLAPGYRADLLIVKESPAEQIGALERPGTVLLNGRVVARDGVLLDTGGL